MFTFKHTPNNQPINWESLSYEWLDNMKNTPQEPEWHAEGDVYIHTKMVAEETVNNEYWLEQNEELKHSTFLASLLHDVAKPICTKIEDGRYVSPKHAKKGEFLARSILWKGEAGNVPPFNIREQICKLVRYHGLPLHFLDNVNFEHKIIKTSQEIDLSLVYKICNYDILGRTCKKEYKDNMFANLEMFKTYCEELNCFKQPYQFQSGLHRFSYSVAFKPIEYIPYDDSWGEIILMSGLPGSGKSTWIKNNTDCPVICLDDLRKELNIDPFDNQDVVLNVAKERAKEYLRKKQPFAWDATMLTTDWRSSTIALFANYGARVKMVYCEAPTFKETLQRNKNRDKVVPENKIQSMLEKLEIPSIHEAHEVVYNLK